MLGGERECCQGHIVVGAEILWAEVRLTTVGRECI